ncbi:MAG: Rieske (2Fe-2S) protein [Planctomycetaceae bacterium]
MDKKPLSTADILASIRKKAAGGEAAAGGDPAPSAPAAPPAPAADATPAAAGAESASAEPLAEESAPPAAKSPAPAAAKPGSTSSILDAIRAGKGAGAAKPAAAGSGDKPAPSAGGAAPKGTSSILASIRAGGAGAAAAPKGDAKAPVAEKPKAEIPASDRPSVSDMVKAVRESTPLKSADAPKAAPKLPGRPPTPAAKPAKSMRREAMAFIAGLFATPFALAWWVFGAINGVLALKTAQFMMPNMVLALPSRFKVGVLSDFPSGGVSEKYKASRGVWIVNTDQYDGRNLVYALASVCTHLGCTPNWLEGEQKYKCPCHGSGFYKNGINFEGPAPRPLERVGIRVAEDGQLEVDKSLKFQEELGQWSDPKSYVEVV